MKIESQRKQTRLLTTDSTSSRRGVRLFVLFSLLLSFSCQSRENNPQELLDSSQRLFDQGDFNGAKLMIDSLRKAHPKAFEQIKQGIVLFRNIEIAEQLRSYNYCDSLIPTLVQRIISKKSRFVFDKNKKYESVGTFYLKGQLPDQLGQAPHLRCGVLETGNIRLTAYYRGVSPLKYSSVKILSADGAYAETPLVAPDGALNYVFNDGPYSVRLITFEQGSESDVVLFIANRVNDPLTVSYEGSASPLRYTLPKSTAKGISECLELSSLMKDLENAKIQRRWALRKINYLKMKEAGIPIRKSKGE